MDLGNFIRISRKKANLTLKELGEKVGVSEQAISQYERNIRIPSNEILKKIENELAINISEEFIKQSKEDKLFIATFQYMMILNNTFEPRKNCNDEDFSIDEVYDFLGRSIVSLSKIRRKSK